MPLINIYLFAASSFYWWRSPKCLEKILNLNKIYAHFFLNYLRFKNNQNYQFHKQNSNYFITTLSNFNHCFCIYMYFRSIFLKKNMLCIIFFSLFVLVLCSFQISKLMVFDEPLCILILYIINNQMRF